MPYNLQGKWENRLKCILIIVHYFKHNEIDLHYWSILHIQLLSTQKKSLKYVNPFAKTSRKFLLIFMHYFFLIIIISLINYWKSMVRKAENYKAKIMCVQFKDFLHFMRRALYVALTAKCLTITSHFNILAIY